jgi:hypothetical protein
MDNNSIITKGRRKAASNHVLSFGALFKIRRWMFPDVSGFDLYGTLFVHLPSSFALIT